VLNRRGDAEQADAAVGKPAVYHHDRCADAHQTEGAERLGRQPPRQRMHSHSSMIHVQAFTGARRI